MYMCSITVTHAPLSPYIFSDTLVSTLYITFPLFLYSMYFIPFLLQIVPTRDIIEHLVYRRVTVYNNTATALFPRTIDSQIAKGLRQTALLVDEVGDEEKIKLTPSPSTSTTTSSVITAQFVNDEKTSSSTHTSPSSINFTAAFECDVAGASLDTSSVAQVAECNVLDNIRSRYVQRNQWGSTGPARKGSISSSTPTSTKPTSPTGATTNSNNQSDILFTVPPSVPSDPSLIYVLVRHTLPSVAPLPSSPAFAAMSPRWGPPETFSPGSVRRGYQACMPQVILSQGMRHAIGTLLLTSLLDSRPVPTNPLTGQNQSNTGGVPDIPSLSFPLGIDQLRHSLNIPTDGTHADYRQFALTFLHDLASPRNSPSTSPSTSIPRHPYAHYALPADPIASLSFSSIVPGRLTRLGAPLLRLLLDHISPFYLSSTDYKESNLISSPPPPLPPPRNPLAYGQVWPTSLTYSSDYSTLTHLHHKLTLLAVTNLTRLLDHAITRPDDAPEATPSTPEESETLTMNTIRSTLARILRPTFSFLFPALQCYCNPARSSKPKIGPFPPDTTVTVATVPICPICIELYCQASVSRKADCLWRLSGLSSFSYETIHNLTPIPSDLVAVFVMYEASETFTLSDFQSFIDKHVKSVFSSLYMLGRLSAILRLTQSTLLLTLAHPADPSSHSSKTMPTPRTTPSGTSPASPCEHVINRNLSPSPLPLPWVPGWVDVLMAAFAPFDHLYAQINAPPKSRKIRTPSPCTVSTPCLSTSPCPSLPLSKQLSAAPSVPHPNPINSKTSDSTTTPEITFTEHVSTSWSRCRSHVSSLHYAYLKHVLYSNRSISLSSLPVSVSFFEHKLQLSLLHNQYDPVFVSATPWLPVITSLRYVKYAMLSTLKLRDGPFNRYADVRPTKLSMPAPPAHASSSSGSASSGSGNQDGGSTSGGNRAGSHSLSDILVEGIRNAAAQGGNFSSIPPAEPMKQQIGGYYMTANAIRQATLISQGVSDMLLLATVLYTTAVEMEEVSRMERDLNRRCAMIPKTSPYTSHGDSTSSDDEDSYSPLALPKTGISPSCAMRVDLSSMGAGKLSIFPFNHTDN